MRSYRFYFVLLAMLLAMPMTVMAAYKADINYIDSLTKVAEQGDVEAQKNLGFEYGLENKYAESAKWFLKAAEQGDAMAQFELGDLYFYKDYGQQNYAEAAKWYRKAADQGELGAQNQLGYLYAKGKGVKQDYAEAAKWYRKAAEQGHSSAQEDLGDLYAEGKGVKQDYAEAAKWYQKAANDELSDIFGYAQEKLGNLYAKGKGVKQDYTEAAKWYQKAADKENPFAQLKLGLFYATGKGVEQDYSKAADLTFKGFKGLQEISKLAWLIPALILFLLLFIIFATIYLYKKYRKAGIKKSRSLLMSLIILLMVIIPSVFLGCLLGYHFNTGGLYMLYSGDFLKLACVPVVLSLVGSFIVRLLATKSKNGAISSESENETSENMLMGKTGHKVKFSIVSIHIISFVALGLAFLFGLPYFGFVTKTLGYDPLARFATLSSSDALGDKGELVIRLVALIVVLILLPILSIMLQRLILGWRNTSTHKDWKNGVIWVYCDKPLKKSRFIKGVTSPFYILGLLSLLISPFVNSITLFLVGVVAISSTAHTFMYVWKLRKEPRDCMIQDIKGEYAVFVLDEDQPADNK